MTAHAIKHHHKPTATPPSTVRAATDNHFLPPSDDDNDNDANPADLMGKYGGGGNNKGKGGHRHGYRDDGKIKALHDLYKEPKDGDNDGRDDENGDSDWDDMEKKEREEDDDDDKGVVKINAVQLFEIPETNYQ